MASFASSATTGGARKHAWTKKLGLSCAKLATSSGKSNSVQVLFQLPTGTELGKNRHEFLMKALLTIFVYMSGYRCLGFGYENKQTVGDWKILTRRRLTLNHWK